jgi:hypothetical protein
MKLQSLFLLLLASLSCGCNYDFPSRWAMDHQEYARRYNKPYPGNELKKLGRKLKQTADARHLSGSTAAYFGVGSSDPLFTVGADIGMLRYSSDSIEHRIGLRSLAGTGDADLMAGIDTGVRFHLPVRFTPFVGAGVYGATGVFGKPAEDDNVDNDDDDSVDEDGETSRSLYAAVYPEIGVSWWLTSRSRVTLSAQHHFSTAGRDYDYTFFGVTLASRSGASKSDAPPRRPVQELESNEGAETDNEQMPEFVSLPTAAEDPSVEDPSVEDPSVEDPSVEDPSVEDPSVDAAQPEWIETSEYPESDPQQLKAFNPDQQVRP